MVVFQELDSFQDLIAFPAKAGEFADQDDVDRVVQAEGERFLENRPILVGLPAGDVLLEDLDYGETVGGSVTLKVFHLAGGVLTGLKGTRGSTTGKDDGFLHNKRIGGQSVFNKIG